MATTRYLTRSKGQGYLIWDIEPHHGIMGDPKWGHYTWLAPTGSVIMHTTRILARDVPKSLRMPCGADSIKEVKINLEAVLG